MEDRQQRAARRAEAVEALDVVGRAPRPDLLAVAELAAQVCGVGAAMVNLYDDSRVHQVATYGFAGGSCAIEDSPCAPQLDRSDPLVVPDCREDERLRDNPYVDGRLGHMRFFASQQLMSREGTALGTLCVLDLEVRHLDERRTAALVTLADRVVDVLELTVRTRQLSASLAETELVRRELERSNELLTSFAGQVSHDLKTPLTSMTLLLALARDHAAETAPAGVLDPELAGMLDRAATSAERMAAVIDDVLAFARLGGTLRHDHVDLATSVREIRDDLGTQLDGVQVSTTDLPVVVGDTVQLRALLQNLVDNAAKFTEPGRPPRVHVAAHAREGRWRIEVVDNGRGVPPEQLTHLFDPMHRGDDTVVGHGIGLATCRRIVQAHGGRIGLDPAPGGGTVAWFELPR